MQDPAPFLTPDVVIAILVVVSLARALGIGRRRSSRPSPHHYRGAGGLRLPIAAGAALAALTFAVLSGSPGTPASLAQTVPGSTQIHITDAGFQPSTLTINPGDSVHWTNDSAQPQSVTSDDGLFDSGSIPPGVGFSIALTYPGIHGYGSTYNTALRADVRVPAVAGAAGLAGPPDDPAASHIPDLAFPDSTDADISIHPSLAIPVSRTRVLVTLAQSASVGQVNAAFSTAGVTVLGGIPSMRWLLVGARDTPDFSALTSAVDSLRGSPAVENASLSPQVQPDEIVVPTLPDLS